MTIYLDILILINLICDFSLLLSVSLILKRNVKIKKIFYASLFGSLTIFILFYNLSNIVLFLTKILLGAIMLIIAFDYKNIEYFFNNLLYFFINSLLLGGFLYFVNLKFNNSVFQSELLLNFMFLVIFAPIVIYIYIKACLKMKHVYSLVYKIEIDINNKKYFLNGYYDTGNALIDPYKGRNIIIVNSNIFKNLDLNILLVPCNTVSGTCLLECFKPNNVIINGVGEFKNLLIGLTKEVINIDGIDCLINKKILEDMK